MRMLRRKSLSVAGIVALALLAFIPASASDDSGYEGAGAVLRDANGVVVGRVSLTQDRGSVIVSGRFVGQTPGFHGFHVHAVGECVAPFTTAGGHHNPGGTGHGQHDGDMPPLLVQANGRSTTVTQTDRFSLAELFDADGSAIIVHAAPDNLANIPTRYVSTETGQPGPDAATLTTGDAGARVACGVVTRR